MLSKDPELKRQRGYTDPKSYVRSDGSEVLYRKDWNRRVVELALRCNGRCEWIVKVPEGLQIPSYGPVQCRSEAADPHHIVKRSKYRDDRLSNLQALCRMHHELLDNRKTRFGEGKRLGGKA